MRVTEAGLFTAKDIERLLGIDSTKLYHWTHTRGFVSPEIEGVGRGKNNQFNIDHLATLSLIKILSDFRLDLETVKWIINLAFSKEPIPVHRIALTKDRFPHFYDANGNLIHAYGVDPVSTWQIYKLDRAHFKRSGLILKIEQGFDQPGLERSLMITVEPKDLKIFDGAADPPFVTCLLVDLLAIIKDLEKRTGREL